MPDLHHRLLSHAYQASLPASLTLTKGCDDTLSHVACAWFSCHLDGTAPQSCVLLMLCYLTCCLCTRGDGVASSISHPEVATDGCSAALDIPKVHFAPSGGVARRHWLIYMMQQLAKDDLCQHVLGSCRSGQQAWKHVASKCMIWLNLSAGGHDVSYQGRDTPGTLVEAVVPAPGWNGACLSA